jgi:hypothetical protein
MAAKGTLRLTEAPPGTSEKFALTREIQGSGGMLVERKTLGLGLIISSLALALASFFLIDRYDDKKGFVSNVMEARYTIWKECKKQADKPIDKIGGVSSYSSWKEKEIESLQCDSVQLPYRWIVVVTSGLFFVGVFVELSKPR